MLLLAACGETAGALQGEHGESSGSSSAGIGAHTDDTGTDSGADSTGDVPAGASVVVTPAVTHLAPGASQLFVGAIADDPDAAFVWSIDGGAAAGSIDAAGRYTAPDVAGTYHTLVFVRLCTNGGTVGATTGALPRAGNGSSDFSA